jgi:oligosaccharide repeat unit polymerase
VCVFVIHERQWLYPRQARKANGRENGNVHGFYLIAMRIPKIHSYAESSLITRSLTNPFAAYTAGFGIAVLVYSLGYSDLYPPLQASLKWFLLSTFVICTFLAYLAGTIVQKSLIKREHFGPHFVVFLILFSIFVVEVLVNGGIPLLTIATGLDFNYQEFGIPSLHVAFVGFAYFYAVYWFDLFVLKQGKGFLVLSLSIIATSLLAVSRGGFITLLIAITVVYIRRRGFDRKLLLAFAAIAAMVAWGFGLLGDLRTHGASGESVILSIGEPSDKFVNSNIPTELFWPYLYASSPLANLQLNITDRTSGDSPALYLALEFLPDVISKRIVSEESRAASVPLLITDALTVCTMYGRAFVLMGWLGLLLSFSYFVAVSVISLKLLQSSKYFVATLGILSSIAFLDMFDNMFTSAGGILPVLVALFLNLFERRTKVDQAQIDLSNARPHG